MTGVSRGESRGRRTRAQADFSLPILPASSESATIRAEQEAKPAELKLHQAYGDLAKHADKERQDSKDKATYLRFLAWIFTAIGAILHGDWKKLLDGSDEGAAGGKEDPPGSD